MNIHLVKHTSNLTDLSKEIYKISGRNAAALQERAGEALMKANPHLTRTGAVPAGSTVIIPEVAGLTMKPSASATLANQVDLKPIAAGLEGVTKLLGQATSDRLKCEQDLGEQLKKNRRALTAANPALAASLDEAARNSQTRIAALKKDQADQTASLRRLGEDLKLLDSVLGAAAKANSVTGT